MGAEDWKLKVCRGENSNLPKPGDSGYPQEGDFELGFKENWNFPVKKGEKGIPERE